jgi:UDP:flavonoid glycosyltransferase YjiC (YdhE family)
MVRSRDETMNITILTAGSRGDVQPYVALGLGLQARGHTVRLVTFEGFREFVESYQLPFAPIRPPAEALETRADWQAWQQVEDRPLRFVVRLRRITHSLRLALAEMLTESWTACQGSEAIVSSLTGFGGPHIAEKLKVPHVWALLQPVSRTRAFPHFMTPARVSLGPWLNQLTYQCADQVFWRLFRWPVNRLRERVLDLPPLRRPGPHSILGQTRSPVVYGFSPTVVPPPPDWAGHAEVAGYWHLGRPPGWRPPDDLVDFLQGGPTPIYVGLGAMRVRDHAGAFDQLLEAVARRQKRAVVLLDEDDPCRAVLPAWAFGVASVPYDWLFPQVAAMALLHCANPGRSEAATSARIRPPRPAHRTRPPPADSPAPRQPARSARAERSARTRARRSRSWRCGPA